MKKIQIYSSNTCGYCTIAKEFFKERNLEYTEFNISEDMSARKNLMKLGYMSVPVILIDGEEVLGFDKERIEMLLQA